MQLYSIETGNFRLDGGSMFGVVPKTLWNKVFEADENNLINMPMRGMLVIDGDRKILIEAGLGEKLDEKFAGYYFLNGDATLRSSLEKTGVNPEEITDVILTHLHFDHCGGAVSYNNQNQPELVFPNAQHWISQAQWENANNPNPLERASYFSDNFLPIQKFGKLELVSDNMPLTENIELWLYNGHTAGLMIPVIQYKNKTVVFVSDLVPTTGNIPLSWIAAYDIQPLVSMDEKKEFLEEAAENEYILYFVHDPETECCTVKQTDKGIRLNQKFALKDI